MPKATPPLNDLDISSQDSNEKRNPKKSSAAKKKNTVSESSVDQEEATDSLAEIDESSTASLLRQRAEADARVMQTALPIWDEENRGVPNPFIRSGLFSVKNTENRLFMQKMPVASLSNYQITYTGQELQQDDLSVWMSLINFFRNQSMSDSVLFTGYSLIKDIGWRMHSESYKRAKESIERLKVTGIEISTNNKETAYSGSLIREYAWTAQDAKGNGRWMVRFESKVSTLFMEDTTTLLEWETRKKIGTRATVAQWLHSFYSSHREPLPLTVAKLYELCRSGDSLSSFRRNIKTALKRLVDIDFLASFSIVNDAVHVQKKLKHNAISENNSHAVARPPIPLDVSAEVQKDGIG